MRPQDRHTNPLAVVVLAAGKGTRMRSRLPKVLHPLRGRPLLGHVLALARSLAPQALLVVAGHGLAEVRGAMGDDGVTWVEQVPQLGTGHAVAQCMPHLWGFAGTVLVLSGDVPLLTRGTVDSLLAAAARSGAPVTLLSGVLDDPTGYGRVLRGQAGEVTGIREQKDLGPGEEAVREGNLGVYAFDAAFLRQEIPLLSPANAQGEYYLTDLVGAAARRGKAAQAVVAADPGEALGVNTRADLAAREATMREKKVRELMEAGVRVMDPAACYVDDGVTVEADAVLHPCVFLHGSTVVRAGAVVHPGCVVTDSTLGEGAELRPHSVANGAVLEAGATAGPFAHLRPGAVLRAGARVGNFVEVKKSVLEAGAKVNHLTYIGDAMVGEGTNVGAGTVTCNYDGFAKHPTVLGKGVFVGSGVLLVAPVTVGDGAIIGAGSTITRDVPADALAVGRARQENKQGWASRWRKGRER